jgi:hypothetical protein
MLPICAAPTASITTTIVFSNLKDSQREFGPIRAMATFGWMCGCWIISGLNADSTTLAGYSGALAWLALSVFTHLVPGVPPQASGENVTWRERMGWDALVLLRNHDHRVVFLAVALFSIPLAAFYPFTPEHLRQLGLLRTSAWMTLGQVTEIGAMFGLATLLARWRLKWIFAVGLSVACYVTRFARWTAGPGCCLALLCTVHRSHWCSSPRKFTSTNASSPRGAAALKR